MVKEFKDGEGKIEDGEAKIKDGEGKIEGGEVEIEGGEGKRRPRASNGQRYPLPCRTHFGNLKCAQQGKGYC